MTPELSEQIERYRRKSIHLIRPSTEPWQEALDKETYGLQRPRVPEEILRGQ